MKIFKDKSFEKKLKSALGSGSLLTDEPMGNHCSFRCGGRAAYFCEPADAEGLAAVIKLLRSEGRDYLILGNGSNVLFKDSGYGGAVVHIGRDGEFASVSVDGNLVTAGAGAAFSAVSREAAAAGLSGLEFACGIPGSVGGAVFMNAGAYEQDVKAVLRTVKCMDAEGNMMVRPAEELGLSYRHSAFEDNGEIVLEAVFELTPAPREDIEAKMADLTKRRTEKQPLQYPSAGSFFKRPEGHFAGKLIQDSGLKGLKVGGAQVSELHAGFVINAGGATATDIIDLMKIVQETVLGDSGVMLEPEVRIIG